MYIPNTLPIDYIVPYTYIIKIHKPYIKITELLKLMNLKNTTTNRIWLNNSIQYMIDNEFINAVKIKNSKYELHDNIKLQPGTFKTYSFKDIDLLMHLPHKCNSISLVKYYINLVKTINYKTHVGCYSLNTLSRISGLNIMTVIKYNNILEGAKIIYFERFKSRRICNRYGLYKDKSFVKEAVDKIKYM